MVQAQCRVEYLRTVPANVFLPQPDVDSAFVRLTPRAPNELPRSRPEASGFARSPRIFSTKKTARKVAASRRSRIGRAPRAEIGVPMAARAEELSLEQWIALSNFVRPALPNGGHGPHGAVCCGRRKGPRDWGRAAKAKCMGITCGIAPFTFSFSTAPASCFLQKRSRWKDRHPQSLGLERRRPCRAPARNTMRPPCASCARNWA